MKQPDARYTQRVGCIVYSQPFKSLFEIRAQVDDDYPSSHLAFFWFD